MVLQDNEIQEIRMGTLRILRIAIAVAGILNIFPTLHHLLLMAVVGVGITIYTVCIYFLHGDPDIISSNPRLIAIRWNTSMLIIVSLTLFLSSYVHASMTFGITNDLFDDVVFLWFLFPLQHMLFDCPIITLYLFIIISCRDGVFVFSFERQDKAVKALYYQIKKFDGTLTYFTLYPRIRYHEFDMVIDVYLKNSQPINDNNNHENIPQVSEQFDIPINADGDMSPSDSTFGLTDPLLTRNNNV
jgi:hypothetical protein